jgi:hypothetical protein
MGNKDRQRKSRSDDHAGPHERKDTLWLLAAGPGIWALHFTLSYVTVAIWCAKVVGRTGDPEGGRIAVGIYTVIALVALGLVTWRGARKAGRHLTSAPHDKDTNDDRHRFLGLATVLLSGLSVIATIYIAFAVIFIGSCR